MHAVVDRFFRSVLDHGRLVVVVFALFVLLCAVCIPSVKVNYTFADYLPTTTPSTVSLHKMEDVFGANLPNTEMYVTGIDLPTAAQLAETMRGIDGINEVTWLGDIVDTRMPFEVLPADTVSGWKSDDGYRYQISMLTSKGVAAKEALTQAGYDAGGERVALAGEAVNTAVAQGSSDFEIQLILLMAFIVVFGLLFLTSKSWFEPVLFTIIIVVAIIINLGTNIIFGEISFITQMCAAVLQLAVSMDYGIVMLHAFRRGKADGLDSYEATVAAMHKGFSVIASSAGTTFCGFLALCVMTFLIGADMGVVLAKGVAFSFITAMILLPVLIMMTRHLLQRTEHRDFLPPFNRFARGCLKLAPVYTVLIVLITVPAYLGQSQSSFIYGASGFVQPGTQVYDDTQLIDDTFDAAESWVLIVPADKPGSEKALVSDLQNLSAVSGVTSYSTAVSSKVPLAFVNADSVSQLVKDGWSRIVVATRCTGEGAESFALVKEVRETAATYYGDDVYLVGNLVTAYDESTTVGSDSLRVLLASVLAIGLILLVMFRSVSIPVILLLSIEISTWINLAIPYFMGTEIQYIGYLVISSIMLGATVDYTIILSRAYLDRRSTQAKRPAMLGALSESAITILTSAAILTVCGALIGVISSNGVIAELGTLIGRGAFIAALNTFLLLPMLFLAFDRFIAATTYHSRFLPACASAAKGTEDTTATASDLPHFTESPSNQSSGERGDHGFSNR